MINMIIDNSMRRRWGFIPNQEGSTEDPELVSNFELGNTPSSGLELSSRFRASAQEWLLTWRIIE